jgi:hypothetical protein
VDPLLNSLLDLLRELDSQGIPLTVGGGFGLYLKRDDFIAVLGEIFVGPN